MTTTRAEVLSKAFDKIEGRGSEEPAKEAAAIPAERVEPGTITGDRSRDDGGRFARKDEKAEPKESATTGAPEGGGEASGAQPAAEAKEGGETTSPVSPPSKAVSETPERPPNSWRASLREVWGQIPTAAQKEITRVHKEAERKISEYSAKARRADEYESAVRPYEAMIRSQGATPAQAIDYVMRAAYSLQAGSPQQKAGMIANMIRNNGIDVQLLDSLLAGQDPGGGQGSQHIDPMSIAEQVERRIQERLSAQASQIAGTRAREKLTKFAESHEFYEDVRTRMADILAGRGNANPSDKDLEEAYDLACRVDPEIRVVVEQREAKKAAEAKDEANRRSELAASSVRSQPTGGSAPAPTGRRAVLERGYDEMARGRR